VLTLYKVTGEQRHANGILDLETNIKTVAIMTSPKAKLLNVFWKKTEPEQDNPLVVIALTKSISHLFKKITVIIKALYTFSETMCQYLLNICSVYTSRINKSVYCRPAWSF
jgi:hypothetical protein